MTATDLAILYVAVGAGCAVAIWRRTPGAILAAALAVPLWPLWAPVALTAPVPPPRRPGRIAAALRDARDAAAGTPLATLLDEATLGRLADDAARLEARVAELDALLARPAFAANPNPESAAARVRADGAARLARLRADDARVLEEAGALADALAAQALITRHGGGGADAAAALVAELEARLEWSCTTF